MQKARRHQINLAPTACKHMVSGSISLPYSGFFSPFPHGTGSLSVSQEYLALPDGPGKFMQGFTCPALLRILLSITWNYLYGTITLCGSTFQQILILQASNIVVLLPLFCRNKISLGYSTFARHYQRNHYCFLLLRVLRCFSSPGLLTFRCNRSSIYQVSPFGNLRVKMYVPLTVAYRSLSRPSSPLRAKESPICS